MALRYWCRTGHGRQQIAPPPHPDAYAPRPPTMANGGSLGGLCGEGQRLAVALLQYICAKIGQHWWGTPADRPISSPRRLRTSIPHHGERGEPGRAVWREAAPSSGAPGAFSASRSEGPAGPPSSARLPTLFRSMDKKKKKGLRSPAQVAGFYSNYSHSTLCCAIGKSVHDPRPSCYGPAL